MHSDQQPVPAGSLPAFADLAFLADHPGHPVELAGETLVQLGDVVERVGDLAADPVRSSGKRTEKSPLRKARSVFSNSFGSS
jgi:hypothetical protein